MKNTKKILAILVFAVMLLGLLAACGQDAPAKPTMPGDNIDIPRTNGMLVLSTDASVNISYDEEGLVISIEGTNAQGVALAEAYTEFLGKSCADVVKDLVTASVEDDFFVKNVIVKQAMGSALPGTSFLDAIVSEAQAAVDGAGAQGAVILVAEENLDADGYINLETAKNILLSHLGIESTTSFDGDPVPSDGSYTFYLVADKIDGYFTVDAVTGIAAELSEEDLLIQEGGVDESIPEDPTTDDASSSAASDEDTQASEVPETTAAQVQDEDANVADEVVGDSDVAV